MNFTYPKKKTKSKITIGLLFSEGKSVSILRLVYHCGPSTDNQKIKWAFLSRETLKSSGQELL
jgi:ribonuclease P protein component